MVLDHGLVMVQFGCTHWIMNVGDRNTFVPLSKKQRARPGHGGTAGQSTQARRHSDVNGVVEVQIRVQEVSVAHHD